MSALERLSAGELLSGYTSRSFSPLEVLEAIETRIEALNPLLGCFTALCLDRARREAVAAGSRYLRGEPAGQLDGVPLAVKDLYDTAELETAYGSAMFAGAVPRRDAEAVARARRAGAIVVGKTQTHEFAWGISSVNPRMGSARNPWDPARIAGGSSGGSAVALAADLAPLALGSDTGGSIRIPSAFCGTVGLKPSYGRVSRRGLFPLAASLDHAGPMARTPADAALLLAATAGTDAADPATAFAPPLELATRSETSLAGLRIGLCPDLHPLALEADLETVFAQAVQLVGELGATVVEVALPEASGAVDLYLPIQRAEALAAHSRAGLYPARAAEYGSDVRTSLERAAEVTLDEYLAASAGRERLRAGFARVFAEVDLLLTPVAACSPCAIGEELVSHRVGLRTLRELVLGFTVPQDLAGLPACAVRAGFDDLGCPVGIQLTGPLWGERRVLAASQAFVDADRELQARRPVVAPAVAGDGALERDAVAEGERCGR